MENSERDGNTRPPDLPLEKFVCRSGSNSYLDLGIEPIPRSPGSLALAGEVFITSTTWEVPLTLRAPGNQAKTLPPGPKTFSYSRPSKDKQGPNVLII